MKKENKEIAEFENELLNYHLPRVSEFPNLELYMDQVIAYLNRNLSIFAKSGETVLTPSMINNYVKHELVPPPNRKKYRRRHLAYILTVCFFKQVLTMNEIKSVVKYQIEKSDEESAYEYFCRAIERALKSCCGSYTGGQAEKDDTAPDNYSLEHSAQAIAHKLYVQRIIEIQDETIKKAEEENKEKEREKAEREKKEGAEKTEKEKSEREREKQEKENKTDKKWTKPPFKGRFDFYI